MIRMDWTKEGEIMEERLQEEEWSHLDLNSISPSFRGEAGQVEPGCEDSVQGRMLCSKKNQVIFTLHRHLQERLKKLGWHMIRMDWTKEEERMQVEEMLQEEEWSHLNLKSISSRGEAGQIKRGCEDAVLGRILHSRKAQVSFTLQLHLQVIMLPFQKLIQS